MHFDEDRPLHIFDCDGVILDSNILKISAFRIALEFVNCPPIFIKWAEEEFRMNFGSTRIQHFEALTKCDFIFAYKLTKKNMIRAIDKYSEMVVELYKECDVIRYTTEFMLKIPKDHLICVVSASDQNELRSILPKKLSHITQENIFGGPVSKSENIKRVLSINKNPGASFYGDAVQDAKAAIENNINFYGLIKYSAAPKELIKFCSDNHLKCYNNCMEIVA